MLDSAPAPAVLARGDSLAVPGQDIGLHTDVPALELAVLMIDEYLKFPQRRA